jgi:phosphate transport system substrate-binding protein
MRTILSKYRVNVLAGVGAAALAVAVGGGCGNSDGDNAKGGSEPQNATAQSSGKSLQIKGSNTMLQLGQKWAEEYQKTSGVNISVDGQGSGTGFKALIDGDTDIAAASRPIKPDEADQAKANGHEAKEFTVAQDGVSIIVNPANKVTQLTMSQLADIFSGKITNWKQVGGDDVPIQVHSRDASSGTYVFFKEHVLNHGDSKGKVEYADSASKDQSSQAIADAVAEDQGAVGYVGMGYVDPKKQRPLKIAKDDKSPFVEPSKANVVNKTYPVSRPLFLYTPGDPTGEVKKFIDWVLSPAGQAIVEKMDFVPVK